jgi:hypothetical protein
LSRKTALALAENRNSDWGPSEIDQSSSNTPKSPPGAAFFAFGKPTWTDLALPTLCLGPLGPVWRQGAIFFLIPIGVLPPVVGQELVVQLKRVFDFVMWGPWNETLPFEDEVVGVDLTTLSFDSFFAALAIGMALLIASAGGIGGGGILVRPLEIYLSSFRL